MPSIIVRNIPDDQVARLKQLAVATGVKYKSPERLLRNLIHIFTTPDSLQCYDCELWPCSGKCKGPQVDIKKAQIINDSIRQHLNSTFENITKAQNEVRQMKYEDLRK